MLSVTLYTCTRFHTNYSPYVLRLRYALKPDFQSLGSVDEHG